MKKLVYGLTLALSISSCQKEKSEIEKVKKDSGIILQWNPCFPDPQPILNTQSKEELFTYEHTQEQENVMRANDYLAKAFIEIMNNNPEIITHVYSYIQAYHDSTSKSDVTLMEFLSVYPEDQSIIEGHLANIMPGEGTINELDQMMVYDIDYKPGFYIPNIESCNWDLAPIITPAIDVNDELYPQTDDDLVLAYYQADQGSPIQEIVLNQQIMDEISCIRPVLGTAHIERKQATAPTETHCNQCGYQGPYGSEFMFYEFKIKNLHERWGNAELYTASAHIAVQSWPFYALLQAGPGSNKKVDKDDRNKVVKNWTMIIDGMPNVTIDNNRIDICNTVFNMWEHDSYQPARRAFTIFSPNGSQYYQEGKRKWTKDWYFQDPFNTEYDFTCFHQAQWATRWSWSGNAEFRIWQMD